MRQSICLLLILLSTACTDEIVRTLSPDAPEFPEEEKLNDGSVANEFMTVYQVDPLIKVIPDPCSFPAGNDTLRAARGETASLQLVVDAKRNLTETSAELVGLTGPAGATLSGATFGWVRNVLSTLVYSPAADDNIASPSKHYPDPIIDDETENITSGKHRSLWMNVPIPETAVSGLYTGTVRINARSGETPVSIEKSFHLEVYPVHVGEPKLLVTNWVFFWFFEQLNRGEKVDTPLYWDLMKELARTCKSLGQNTYRIDDMCRWPTGVNPDGSWQFDFSTFDKVVELFIEYGGLKCIEAGHLLTAQGAVGTPFVLPNGCILNERGTFEAASFQMSPEGSENNRLAKIYLKNYLTALRAHLAEKGWLDMFVQHIGDEPTGSNHDSWRYFAEIVKEFYPDIRLMDAIDEGGAQYLDDICDILCPKLDILHKHNDLFEARRAAGKKDWFYTCMFPMGNYANRFVNLPLLKTRILHWLNYKSGTVGYLHWGLMYWFDGNWQMNLWQNIYQDCSKPGNYFPGGDSYILYPGYRKFYSSIRANAMRDGIHDYNLLKMVEERDPAKAEAFVEAMAPDYDRYDMNVPHFRQIRKEMLEFLSGTSD